METGLHSNVGQRLCAVRAHVEDEPMFLANYSDGLTDMPLDVFLERFRASQAIGGLLAVRTPQSFHALRFNAGGAVQSIGPLADSDVWINGGFFAFRPEIFDYLVPGEELVEQPLQRLTAAGKLFAMRHEGFWASMDTLKDKIQFDRRHARGDAPWQIWNRTPATAASSDDDGVDGEVADAGRRVVPWRALR